MSGVNKDMKRLNETGSALLKIESSPSGRENTFIYSSHQKDSRDTLKK